MNDLRLILLILGVILILSIYLWESYRERGRRRRSTVLRSAEERGEADLRMPVAAETTDDFSDAIADLNRLLAERRGPGPEAGGAAPWPVREGEAPGVAAPERIIVLYVAATRDRSFDGRAILSSARSCSLQHGPMGIFHFYGDDFAAPQTPVFSVADMHEPGTFDPEAMDSFSTSGLSMFMRVPSPIDPGEAFDAMLGTARRLARELGGDVYGPDRARLDDRRAAELRRSVQSGAVPES
jgi:cell division protein ZipA